MVSARTPRNVSVTYQIEDNRKYNDFKTHSIKVVNNNVNPNNKKHLIFIHGFRVKPDGSFSFRENSEIGKTNDSVQKRVYWTGFRGNYIGFAWDGDIGRIIDTAFFFDYTGRSAFRSSPALRKYLW